jgi:hypothetical protein
VKRQAKIELFLSDARGVYIPRDFAESIRRECILNVTPADLDELARGPDVEGYWDLWQEIIDVAILVSATDGTKYRIHQDGDCWLVEDGAEFDENSDFDLGYYVDDGQPDEEEESAPTVHCDRCAMLSINGIACHEIGCANMGARWDGDTWIKQRECRVCGYTCDADSACCESDE